MGMRFLGPWSLLQCMEVQLPRGVYRVVDVEGLLGCQGGRGALW